MKYPICMHVQKLEKEISRLKEKLKAVKDKQIQTEALLQVTVC